MPKEQAINVSYHHFCKHMQKGLIKIFPINTKDQIADALTKALAQNVEQNRISAKKPTARRRGGIRE
jgi:hypothetical protein